MKSRRSCLKPVFGISIIFLLAPAVAPAADATLANEDFSQVASKLGAASTADGCRSDRGKLTKSDSNAIDAKQFDLTRFEADANSADWACVELKDHLKDDHLKGCTPDPQSVFNFSPATPMAVSGKESFHFASFPSLKFRGFHVSKPYHYEVATAPDGKTEVTVKIHFTGTLTQDAAGQKAIQDQLNKAAQLWGSQSPGQKVEFKFLSVGKDEAGYTVNLTDKDKANLYYSHWAAADMKRAAPNTVAHEIGHMMGIPDQYDPVRDTVWEVKDEADTRRCDIRGMMCDPDKGKTYPYYYYLILRRAACAARDQGTAPAAHVASSNSPDESQEVADAAEDTSAVLPLLQTAQSATDPACNSAH